MSDFPITLAFPPQGHFTQPHLAIPCLVAYLRSEGFDDVEQRDLSIEAYDHFLSRDYLTDCAERARARLPLDPTGGAVGNRFVYRGCRSRSACLFFYGKPGFPYRQERTGTAVSAFL